MKTIWVHTLVKNEERFLWYSVKSVIDFIDKILLWDTGSTDNTLKVINKLQKKYPNKISFKQIGEISSDEFTKARQQMLDETKSDWFLVVDGDEVWWDESIKKVADFIQSDGDSFELIVVPNILPVGDIYHYLEKAAGRYKLAGKEGHYALRGVKRNILGLKSDKPHGTWGWVDNKNRMIQDRNPKKIKFIDAPYLHTTFLRRSSLRQDDLNVPKRAQKYKYELGNRFSLDYYYPESFLRSTDEDISLPWETMDRMYYLKALVETPFKKIKRRLIHGKTGY